MVMVEAPPVDIEATLAQCAPFAGCIGSHSRRLCANREPSAYAHVRGRWRLCCRENARPEQLHCTHAIALTLILILSGLLVPVVTTWRRIGQHLALVLPWKPAGRPLAAGQSGDADSVNCG